MISIDINKACNKLLINVTNQIMFASLREHFSVENAGAEFVRRKLGKLGRRAFIASRKYAITPGGKADIGMLWEIRSYILKNCQAEEVIISDNLKTFIGARSDTTVQDTLKYKLRDYQYESVSRALKYGWGNIVLGTGAGKTLTSAALVESYFNEATNKATFKCLIVVPDLGLVTQTNKEFEDYNVTFTHTMWTGKCEPDLNANVIICNMGILRSRFEESEWVKYVDVLIADEVHKIKPDNKITTILDEILTKRRFGFTGTMPVSNMDKWFILGKFGPVLYKKTSFELREEKHLVDAKVNILNIHYNDIHVSRSLKSGYKNELDFIYSSELRNKFIAKLAGVMQYNTLILVNHITHGTTLLETLTKMLPNKRVFFIQGSVEVEERDRIKSLMEEQDDIICIAVSAIFSTGINIKNLHNIFFVAGGKAFIRLVQSIGRGLRKHESKILLNLYDFCDALPYSIQHGDKRKRVYEIEKIPTVEKVVDLS